MLTIDVPGAFQWRLKNQGNELKKAKKILNTI